MEMDNSFTNTAMKKDVLVEKSDRVLPGGISAV